MACIPGTRLNARPSLPGRFENDFLGSEFVLLIQFQGVQLFNDESADSPDDPARRARKECC